VVRGRNGANRVLRTDMGFESAAVTSAPYTAARAGPCQAGQNVSVSGSFPSPM
jgi:hypothetical protein